mmetsp:Transcript_50745/g.145642  ORF Transcript_50745/g.145642 Transcript_50745/m.145642 type:complete len:213 (-) Transcript_50745:61-699(-)
MALGVIMSLISLLAVLPALVFAKKVVAATGCDQSLKGLFGEPKKDTAVMLCDENYPSTDSADSWLILFYHQSENTQVGKYFDVQLNKIAKDFGNDLPKGKKGKTKKHRKRIEFLADKYEFLNDLTLPKKGLSDTAPLMKVGAMCCDCAIVPAKCHGRSGLELNLIHAGQETKLELDVRKIPETVQGVLAHLNYCKPRQVVSDGFGESEDAEL